MFRSTDPRRRISRAALLPVLVAVTLLVTGMGATPVRAAPLPLTNLAHLDFLGDVVTPPTQAGHTTYRLADEPSLRVLWTYAEPQADGSYRRLGGGTYHPDTNTYGQGAFNTDDLTRAAVVYLRHWRQFGTITAAPRPTGCSAKRDLHADAHRPTRGGQLRALDAAGRDAQSRARDPEELPDPSDSEPPYWLARSIWALGEGYEAFRDADPAFAAFLRTRLELALDALDREVLARYGSHRLFDGANVPAWLIVDGADASSEAVYGLSAYTRADPGNARARLDLERLGDGVAEMALSDSAATWPFAAILPYAGSRSLWHAWGDQMAGALATAGSALGEDRFTSVAVTEAARFTPHLLVQGGADRAGCRPRPSSPRSPTARTSPCSNLLRTADASGPRRLPAARRHRGQLGTSGTTDRRSRCTTRPPVRTFDGLEADGASTELRRRVHHPRSALDARPRCPSRCRRCGYVPQHPCGPGELVARRSRIVGTLKGKATVVRRPAHGPAKASGAAAATSSWDLAAG